MTLSVIRATNCTYSYEAMYTHLYVTWTIIPQPVQSERKMKKKPIFRVELSLFCSHLNEQQQQCQNASIARGGKKETAKEITKIITCIRTTTFECFQKKNEENWWRVVSAPLQLDAEQKKKLFSTNFLSTLFGLAGKKNGKSIQGFRAFLFFGRLFGCFWFLPRFSVSFRLVRLSSFLASINFHLFLFLCFGCCSFYRYLFVSKQMRACASPGVSRRLPASVHVNILWWVTE